MKKISIEGVEFRNPVITASGTFGMGGEYSDFFSLSEIGGITLKTVTKNPRKGNPSPRIIETPCGMLNSIGLANEGFDKVYSDLKKHDYLAEYDTNVVFSIAGESVEDFIEMARSFSEFEGIDIIELNLSCPNIHAGGKTFDSEKANITAITEGVKNSIKKPFSVKLSPNNDLVENAKTASKAGASALTISNTFLGMAIDIKTGKPHFKNIVAGFSGPAVKPMALYNVYRIAQSVDIPVIASGGISSVDDAKEFLIAGATLISVGTFGFVEPDIAGIIARELN